MLEDQRSAQIVAYTKSLNNRELEFRLRCKMFGLSYSYSGIVQRTSTEYDYDAKKEIMNVRSFVQCIDDSDDE